MIDKTKKLFIFGTGQFSKIITQYFERYTNYKIVGYIDSKKQKNSYSDKDVLVLSEEEFLESHSPDDYHMFIAVGYTNMNKNRSEIFKKYKNFGFSFVNFIHPNVVWWDNSDLGENSFIFENNVVQQNVSIGDNVIVWSGNHIGHDTEIQDNVWITSHVVIYSNVLISKNCFIGSNSNLKDGIKVGCGSFIGASSNIWQSAPNFSVFGVKPSKPLSVKSDQISNLLV